MMPLMRASAHDQISPCRSVLTGKKTFRGYQFLGDVIPRERNVISRSSISSIVLGQIFLRSCERDQLARIFPPVWQREQ